jgi:hypothetical protein
VITEEVLDRAAALIDYRGWCSKGAQFLGDWLPPILFPVTLWPLRTAFVVAVFVIAPFCTPIFVPRRFRK